MPLQGPTRSDRGTNGTAAIAVVLLTDPSVMERPTGSLLVIGGALAASGIVVALDRRRAVRAAS